ncbi:hypothetical protein RRG08_014557 [Elysia crispata]|uniref:Uncharacterized protein n=1 Tax=Elysia crispata TaxID=231223 RepID=A0AAE1ASI1_9GAST|nr:hypothetical protein RRG08_014557 [Elysia crispata]
MVRTDEEETFNKDVKTVLMTCLGCLFSEKPPDGENRDEEETFNKDVKTVLMTCLGCLFSEKLSHGENRDEEETFNKDVKTVLMTCLGCLFSEKPPDGENRDEEETFNKDVKTVLRLSHGEKEEEETFNKDVKTVLMTCLGCLFSEKPPDGENRDEEETFNKDVKTVLMTCLGCLFSEKLSHGENRDEEEKNNRHEECTILYVPSVPDQPGLTVGSRFSSEHELPLCAVRRCIQAAGKAALGENGDESSSSTEVYIPQESSCSGVSSFYGKDKESDAQEEEIRGRRKKRKTKEQRDTVNITDGKIHRALKNAGGGKCHKKCHDRFAQRLRNLWVKANSRARWGSMKSRTSSPTMGHSCRTTAGHLG